MTGLKNCWRRSTLLLFLTLVLLLSSLLCCIIKLSKSEFETEVIKASLLYSDLDLSTMKRWISDSNNFNKHIGRWSCIYRVQTSMACSGLDHTLIDKTCFVKRVEWKQVFCSKYSMVHYAFACRFGSLVIDWPALRSRAITLPNQEP